MGYGITVLVKGDRACFTRPEMHTERVSYDVITPSAARGVLEAVYWKPAIRWVIDEITVINPVKFDSIRRNEVKHKAVESKLKSAMKNGSSLPYLNTEEDRAQRNTLYLKNVAYVVAAHFELTDNAGESDTPEKHYNIALRRLRKGQHFNQPYLGCREFPAEISLIEDGDKIPDSFYKDIDSRDLGYMLYDLDFSNPNDPIPLFYRPIMENGFIDVAKYAKEVAK